MAETTTEIAIPEALVDVRTGEMLPATIENAAQLLAAARDLRDRVRNVIRDCEIVLAAHKRIGGKGTFRAGGLKVEVKGGNEIVWDLAKLHELLDAGLPPDRYQDLVTETIEYKVSAAVAREISSANPKYAEIIKDARRDFPKNPTVSLS